MGLNSASLDKLCGLFSVNFGQAWALWWDLCTRWRHE